MYNIPNLKENWHILLSILLKLVTSNANYNQDEWVFNWSFYYLLLYFFILFDFIRNYKKNIVQKVKKLGEFLSKRSSLCFQNMRINPSRTQAHTFQRKSNNFKHSFLRNRRNTSLQSHQQFWSILRKISPNTSYEPTKKFLHAEYSSGSSPPNLKPSLATV